jgi:hypothetical protein
MYRQLVDYLNNGSIMVNLWGKQVLNLHFLSFPSCLSSSFLCFSPYLLPNYSLPVFSPFFYCLPLYPFPFPTPALFLSPCLLFSLFCLSTPPLHIIFSSLFVAVLFPYLSLPSTPLPSPLTLPFPFLPFTFPLILRNFYLFDHPLAGFSFTHSGNSRFYFPLFPWGSLGTNRLSTKCPSAVRPLCELSPLLFPTVTIQDSIVHQYVPEVVTSTI